MRIVGLGMDVVEISRIERAIGRYGDRFLARVFTDCEIAYCRARHRSAQSFAARFAAKEAAMKALGTGLAHGVSWLTIEVLRQQGPPYLVFHGAAHERLAVLGGDHALVTLTHGESLALAHVILIGR